MLVPRTNWTFCWMTDQSEELWRNRDSKYHAAGQLNIKNRLHHELSQNGTLFLILLRLWLWYLRLEASCLPQRCHYVNSTHPPHHRDIQWRLILSIQIQIQTNCSYFPQRQPRIWLITTSDPIGIKQHHIRPHQTMPVRLHCPPPPVTYFVATCRQFGIFRTYLRI